MLRCIFAVVGVLVLSGCPPDMVDGDPMADGGPDHLDAMVGFDGGEPRPLLFNQVQMRGTVNSYHDYFRDGFGPEVTYRHLPLDQQAVEQGIRQFDFDLAGDRVAGISLWPQTSELGFDAESHCGDWLGCLWELRDWSDAHPAHPMVVVLVGEAALWGDSPPFLHHQLDDVEDWIVGALGRARLYTPADMRRGFASLQEAIAEVGWPAIDETRGKVLFVLNDRGVGRLDYIMHGGLDPDDPLLFLVGDPDLAGDAAVPDEVIFTFEPEGPWVYETDPAALPRIREIVRANYLVHATTDDPDFAAALRDAGAHMIGTRFPEMLGPVLEASMVCNPVTRPAGCRGVQIDPGPR